MAVTYSCDKCKFTMRKTQLSTVSLPSGDYHFCRECFEDFLSHFREFFKMARTENTESQATDA